MDALLVEGILFQIERLQGPLHGLRAANTEHNRKAVNIDDEAARDTACNGICTQQAANWGRLWLRGGVGQLVRDRNLTVHSDSCCRACVGGRRTEYVGNAPDLQVCILNAVVELDLRDNSAIGMTWCPSDCRTRGIPPVIRSIRSAGFKRSRRGSRTHPVPLEIDRHCCG